jgi:hypothetical protein
MSSPYARDFSLLARLQDMRAQELARLEEREERFKASRRWRT